MKMSCCGNEHRADLPGKSRPIEQTSVNVTSRSASTRQVEKLVNFEYTGPSALTALGPLTGQRYRFAAPGAVIAVDARDAAYLMAVPHLKRAHSQPG
jgi:hypothetical protein